MIQRQNKIWLLLGFITIAIGCSVSRKTKKSESNSETSIVTYMPVYKSEHYKSCDTCFRIVLTVNGSDTSWVLHYRIRKMPYGTINIEGDTAITEDIKVHADVPGIGYNDPPIKCKWTMNGDTLNMFNLNYIVKGDSLFPTSFGQYIYIKKKFR